MATLYVFGKGFNYSQDGPGNRLVYHLQGCNLHCPWCANPEGIALGGSLLQTDRVPLQDAFCPRGAITQGALDRTRCRGCDRVCADLHTGALSRSETAIESNALIAEVLRSRAMFFEGGGVTFTGGEATLQFDALSEVLKALKQHGIHTALETNGTHPHLGELLPYIDYLIMDVKHADAQVFARVIGSGFSEFAHNLRLATTREQLALRIPLIHSFNTQPSDLQAIATLIASLNAPTVTVELLRYHEYGKDKWRQIGLPYEVTDGYVSDEDYLTAQSILQDAGLRLFHT